MKTLFTKQKMIDFFYRVLWGEHAERKHVEKAA